MRAHAVPPSPSHCWIAARSSRNQVGSLALPTLVTALGVSLCTFLQAHRDLRKRVLARHTKPVRRPRMPQPSVHLEVAGILCSARSPRLGLLDRPRRVLPLPSALHEVSLLPWDPMTVESGNRHGARVDLFPVARIHWSPSTVIRERRDLLRSPPLPRPICLPPGDGLRWAPDHRGPVGHVPIVIHTNEMYKSSFPLLYEPRRLPRASAGFRFPIGPQRIDM